MADRHTEEKKDYKVLARKYRPGNFSELIGQKAMVRTLRNAFEAGRIAHAFILTGVRGVGKTTTARLIARALNCDGADGRSGPTVEPCGVCENCIAIAESRHVDVIEMDAASRTGVDDIREIIDGVQYAPASARFKVYIIDEVHMLSKNAFNALLKTLEEPPPHVKFIFATTEIRKLPVTVLSRCQRFDLRRVEGEELINHFRSIVEKESCEAEGAAIAMIARAAEGSVRDGLSLLDQAIAHGAGKVTEDQVRDMLGLADRALTLDLFQAAMAGDAKKALMLLQEQHRLGADPLVVLQDLLEATHWITRLKLNNDAGSDALTSEAERTLGRDMAEKLAMPQLTRAWQLLLKGLNEARMAPGPMAAVEMVLIRLIYAADLPDPAHLIKQIRETKATSAPVRQTQNETSADVGSSALLPKQQSAPSGTGATQTGNVVALKQELPRSSFHPMPGSFESLVDLFERQKEGVIGLHLRDHVHLISYRPGRIEMRASKRASADLAGRLRQCLKAWTGEEWQIVFSNEQGGPTLRTQDEEREEALLQEALATPVIKKALETFPGAKIIRIVERQQSSPASPDRVEEK